MIALSKGAVRAKTAMLLTRILQEKARLETNNEEPDLLILTRQEADELKASVIGLPPGDVARVYGFRVAILVGDDPS